MGAAQAKLNEQPEIIDLLSTLEQSKLMKERQPDTIRHCMACSHCANWCNF